MKKFILTIVNCFLNVIFTTKYTLLFFMMLLSISRHNLMDVPYNIEAFCQDNKDLEICKGNKYLMRIIIIMLELSQVITILFTAFAKKDKYKMIKHKIIVKLIVLFFSCIITSLSMIFGEIITLYQEYNINTGYHNHDICNNYNITYTNYEYFNDYCQLSICNRRHILAYIGGCSLIGYSLIFALILAVAIIITPIILSCRSKNKSTNKV